jgi:hypothetical protein
MDIAEALVGALVDKGQLSGDEVDLIIANAVAQRQRASEHERRRQWEQRVENAAAFQDESS